MLRRSCPRLIQALGALALLASTPVNALPITMDLTGTVSAAEGAAIGLLDSSVNAHIVFDLDAGNALRVETFAANGGEPAFSRWTFSGSGVNTGTGLSNSISPYNQTSFSGDFGTFSNPGFLDVEILDNLDADALGNPFGLSGIVDVLSVLATTDTVNCVLPYFIDPATGACTDPDATGRTGEVHTVNFIAASDWFSGIAALPGAMLPMSDWIGVFGSGEEYDNDAVTARIEVTYQALKVPTPSTVLLLLAGLGLLLRGRCRDHV